MRSNDELNQMAFDDPLPGDYWHEMCCPYFIILEVLENNKFVICKERMSIDKDYWAWNLGKCEVVDKKFLTKKLKYSTIDGFCADVVRGGEKSNYFVDEYLKDYKDNIKIVDNTMVASSFVDVMSQGI